MVKLDKNNIKAFWPKIMLTKTFSREISLFLSVIVYTFTKLLKFYQNSSYNLTLGKSKIAAIEQIKDGPRSVCVS